MIYFATRNLVGHRRCSGLLVLGVSIIGISAALSVSAAQNSGSSKTMQAETDPIERIIRDSHAMTEFVLGDFKPLQRGQRIEQVWNHVLGLSQSAPERVDRMLAIGMESFGGVLLGLRDAAQIVEDLASDQPGMGSSMDIRSAVIDLQTQALHLMMHAPERAAWVAFFAPGAIEDVNLFWEAVQDGNIEDEQLRTNRLVNAWRVTIAGYFSQLGEHELAAEAHERAIEQLFSLGDDDLARYLASMPGSGPQWLLESKAIEQVRGSDTAAAIETLDRIAALPDSLRSGPIHPDLPAPTIHSHAVTVTVITSAWKTSNFPIEWLDRIDWNLDADEHSVIMFIYVMLGGGPPDETHEERNERLEWIVRRGEFLLYEKPDLLDATNAMRTPGAPEPTEQYERELATANMMYGLYIAYQQLGRKADALTIGEQLLERFNNYPVAASVADGVFRMRREKP